jgi:hypothetical protein
MFKQHLQMIGYNESPNKKAKFWQSYVRSLKGSDDIRAQETRHYDFDRRPLSHHFSHLYEDVSDPHSRVQVPGYRYLPVHRETYGYSPRAIYPHHYASRPIRPARQVSPVPSSFGREDVKAFLNARSARDVERAYDDHLKRMKEIEHRYPSRYGLYLKDRPHSLLPQDVEYEPETKPIY